MFHSAGHFIILYLSFYYLLLSYIYHFIIFWQISEKELWQFCDTFVSCDSFVTVLWKVVTLLWHFCNFGNFIIFLLSFNYLVTLLWHFCDTFVKILGPQLNLSTKVLFQYMLLILKHNFRFKFNGTKRTAWCVNL